MRIPEAVIGLGVLPVPPGIALFHQGFVDVSIADIDFGDRSSISICIDFIDMHDRTNNKELFNTLKAAAFELPAEVKALKGDGGGSTTTKPGR